MTSRVTSSRATRPSPGSAPSNILTKRSERDPLTTSRSKLGTPTSPSRPTEHASRTDTGSLDSRPSRLPETTLASARPNTKPSARSFGSYNGNDHRDGGGYNNSYGGHGSNYRDNDYYGGDSHRGYNNYNSHYNDSWYHSRRYNHCDDYYGNYYGGGWSFGWNSGNWSFGWNSGFSPYYSSYYQRSPYRSSFYRSSYYSAPLYSYPTYNYYYPTYNDYYYPSYNNNYYYYYPTSAYYYPNTYSYYSRPASVVTYNRSYYYSSPSFFSLGYTSDHDWGSFSIGLGSPWWPYASAPYSVTTYYPETYVEPLPVAVAEPAWSFDVGWAN